MKTQDPRNHTQLGQTEESASPGTLASHAVVSVGRSEIDKGALGKARTLYVVLHDVLTPRNEKKQEICPHT